MVTTGMSREQRSAALVAVRGDASRPVIRRGAPPSCRCRPGEVAEWVRLDLPTPEAEALRDATAAAGVALDAWLAVTVEFSISLCLLGDALGSLDAARRRLSQGIQACPIEVAWLPAWRAWQSSLGRRAQPALDELPEVVLPQRLLVRGGGTVDVTDALRHAGDWPLAWACELVASGRGQTLEAFVLQLGLTGTPRARY
jgi:hypothetical protein